MNMSPTDQQLLEDFDTERLDKRGKKIIVQKPSSFRSQWSCVVAAAEHGAARPSASVNAKKPPAFRSQKPRAAAAAKHGAASSSTSVVTQMKSEDNIMSEPCAAAAAEQGAASSSTSVVTQIESENNIKSEDL